MPNRAAPEPTKGQFESVGNLGRAAAATVAEGSGMSREQVQQLWLSQGDKIQAGFAEVLRQYGILVNPYETELDHLASDYNITMPTLEVQADRIKRVLGVELNWPREAQNMSFATGVFGADGIALWPTLPTLGRLWSISDPRVSGYGNVIAAACNAINKSTSMARLMNYRAGELGQRIRIHAKVMAKLESLEDEAERQGFNALVMPVNLGDWHTGYAYSPRNARWQCINLMPNCLAIEPVAGLSLLIAILERLNTHGQLFCNFTGAEYDWLGSGTWSSSLSASFHNGRFEFNAYPADCTSTYRGAFVGFPGVSEPAS